MMISKSMERDRGFTLIEILLALFVGLLVMSAIYAVMVSGQKASVAIDRKVVAQQDSRATLEVMAVEIGMASYNETFTQNIWSGTQAYKGIQQALDGGSQPISMDRAITVQMDINQSRNIGDSPNEIISYVYDAGNQMVTRETNDGLGPQAFLGNSQGSPRSVRVINNTLNIPLFRYYDALGNEIQVGNLPANIPSIRKIDVTLAVETDEIDANTGQRRQMIYSTSVMPRNHIFRSGY